MLLTDDTQVDIVECMKTIFDQLRDAAKRDERSMNALAESAGLRYASVYEFVKKGRDIKLTTAAKLAAVLGLGLTPVATSKPATLPARVRARRGKVGR